MASQVISTQEFQSYVFASYENNLSNLLRQHKRMVCCGNASERRELTFVRLLGQA